jgi:dGTPase
VDDALRAKLLVITDLPQSARRILGETSTQRIDFLVRDLVRYSTGKNAVSLSPDIARVLKELRSYLFDNVYVHQLQKSEREKIQTLLRLLFEYYIKHPQKLPDELRFRCGNDPAQAVADYIAGMTDRFAMKRFREIYMPAAWEA